MCRGRALVWDIGPRQSFGRWADGYRALGCPYIEQLVLSHTDEDHRGGLALLDSGTAFSGLVVVSVYEDTALIRRCAGAWTPRLRFRTIAAGDTLGGLDAGLVQCLWPPRGSGTAIPVPADERNSLSLVFRVAVGESSVLITSDIDSAAEWGLVAECGSGLASDIVVVPHHGSADAAFRPFYGHVMPVWAVVSCAAQNDFGHPSDAVVDLLFGIGVGLLSTATEGHVCFRSNGVYWTRTPVTVGPMSGFVVGTE
ncbi:MAG: hypothetical protein GF331_24135 [Chitinivibrionales bacterium]|nr:hypothetical protein [Chitinivibrionales bacterium]